jgi:hypothetical protein
MAHEVTFELPKRRLGKADIWFVVKRNGKAFGRLLVSKGSIVWRQRNQQRGKKLPWVRLDELMQDQGKRE